MPVYGYRCTNGHRFEVQQRITEPPLTVCPQCGAPLEPGFGFCPGCRYRLNPGCPKCQRAVHAGDKFCPYCGGDLGAGANEVVDGAGSAGKSSGF